MKLAFGFCYAACIGIRIVEVLPGCGPDVLSQAY